MKVNLRKNMEKEKRPQTVNLGKSSNTYDSLSVDDFRLYITNLENLLKDTLNENIRLRQQISEFTSKKNQTEMKKYQARAEELIKSYSRGKIYLNDLEKKMSLGRQFHFNIKDININKNSINDNQNNDAKIQNIISQYESELESLLEQKFQVENKLNSSEKEKDDLKNKFNDEFVLMSSVIYNLGFLYWSMKSDYEDKLKQNKGWLEMERIKQYNGDY